MPRFLEPLLRILLLDLARGALVFHTDPAFSNQEAKLITIAQTQWNRYSSLEDCRLENTPYNPRGSDDIIFRIKATQDQPLAHSFTATTFVIRENTRTVINIEISLNLLYLRHCPNAFYPFILHELGHALGLPHSTHPSSIMNITSLMPACALYAPFSYLPGIDVYNLHHLLGSRCQTNPAATTVFPRSVVWKG